MSSEEPVPHAAALAALRGVLVEGVDQPPRTDWWSNDWDPVLHLLGTRKRGAPRRELPPDARADFLAIARGQIVGAAPDEDDALLRLFCGALLKVVADAEDTKPRTAESNQLRAARVLLGVAPPDYYAALLSEDGDETWEPVQRSRKQIYEAMQRNTKAAVGFRDRVDPTSLTTRRTLASLIETDGSRSFDSYARRDRFRIRGIATTLLARTAAALADTDTLSELVDTVEHRHDRIWAAPMAATDGAVRRSPARSSAADRTAPQGVGRYWPARRGASVVAGGVAAAAALILVTTVLAPRLLESVPRTQHDRMGTSDKPSESARPIPTPPGPGETDSQAVIAPSFSGSLSATNVTTGEGDDGGWIAAVPEDEIKLRLTLTNEGDVAAGDVFLRPRSYIPPSNKRLRVIDFTVRQGEEGPETIVNGASVVIEPEDGETCELEQIWPGAMTMNADEEDRLLVQSTSWSGTPVEGINTLAQYALPVVDAGAEVSISTVLSINGPSDQQPQIAGSLRFKHADDEEAEYAAVGEAAVGDVLKVALRLHNPTCLTWEARTNVKETIRPFNGGRNYIQVTAEARTADTDRPRTKFDPITINVSGDQPITLEQVPGTTAIYAETCDAWELLDEVGDWLLQGGVDVSVPGYIRRMECEEHTRYVTTQFRVVALE